MSYAQDYNINRKGSEQKTTIEYLLVKYFTSELDEVEEQGGKKQCKVEIVGFEEKVYLET